MITKYLDILKQFADSFIHNHQIANGLANGIAFVSLLFLGILLYMLARFLIKKTIYIFIQRTPSKYDDLLIKNKVLTRICLLIPAIIIKYYANDTLPNFPDAADILLKIEKIYEIVIYTSIMLALVNTGHDLYNSFDFSKQKPIEGLIQVLKGILYSVCVLLVAAGRWQRIGNQPYLGESAKLGQHHHHHPDLYLGFEPLHQLARNVGIRRKAHSTQHQHRREHHSLLHA